MLENLQDRVESLARTTVLTDAADLPGLVSLQEQATVLAADLDGAHAADVSAMARQVSALAEAIVMRTAADVDAAFKEIGTIIDRLQTAASNMSAVGGFEPESPTSESCNEDKELIAAWVAGCEGTLADLEGKLLALERTPADAETLAEVRRMMHTLKGECGVLSLHVPQKLCHEAESLLDQRVEAGAPAPIDPLLLLLDWLKSYVSRLAVDHSAKPDDGADVLAAFQAAGTSVGTNPPVTPVLPASMDQGVPQCSAPQPEPVSPVASSVSPSPSPAAVAASPEDSTPVRVAPQPGTEENLSDFLCESKDHLTNAEEALLALDQDRGNVELINTVFRAFHTIKGVSGFMALTPIVSLAHSAEQLLDGARSGAIALTRGDLDQILAACDMMSKLMGVLQGGAGPTQAELKALVARLDAAASGTSMNEPPAAAPTAAIIAAPVAAPKQVAASTPAVHIAAPSPGIAQAAPPVAAEAAPQSQPAPAAETDHKTKKSDQTVKVSTTRMDSLVTMVGELVIAQQMVVQDVAALGGNAQRVQRTLAHMSKMVRELQEVSMSLRMVNLKSTFQKMTRLVRDVSQKAGKQIDVVTEGEEVELDRNVVEAITDPLVHMIRNACDHGVEGPEERRSVGKSPNGRLSMRAYHAGGSIVIEIGDDGRGLRREKLLAKAHAKGLLPADNNDAAMPDSEVFALIFLPGFSTAEKVTDISGRGVGMDVVRRNIEALRGKVDIRSTPGQGTTFVLRLPLTMAIIDGMVVRVGSQRYVLPTLSIEQSFRPKADDIKTVVGAGEMVMVRGSMLPVYRLNRVLGRADGGDRIEDGLLIVMETHDARFCLMVDVIVGQQSVVIKTLTQTGQHVRGVSGGAILGDGRVALILDVSQVVALALEGGGQAQSSESATISTRSVRTGAVVGAE